MGMSASRKELLDRIPGKFRLSTDLALDVVNLRRALGYFLEDPRFTVAVGGNPHAIEKMFAEAMRIYQETEFRHKRETPLG